MQHGDLDKTKVLKTERFQEWDKETKFQECDENIQLVRPVLHTGQTGITHWSDRFTLS
jgi:hypothetical protein